jgi:cytochrome c-type biogenesis protein CcmH/NrfG
MRDIEPSDHSDIKRLRLYLYFIPVFGIFPAFWTLYRNRSDRQERNASRLTVLLTLIWVVSYLSLGTGAQATETSNITALLLNSLLTSGYFATNFWLMVRVWQQKPLWIPGLSRLVDRKATNSKRSS